MLNAVAVANARNVDVLLLTELYYPTYHKMIQVPGWDAICSPRSMILVRRDIIHATQPLPHADVVAAHIGDMLVLCSYASPNEDPTDLFHFLQQLVASSTLGIVLGG